MGKPALIIDMMAKDPEAEGGEQDAGDESADPARTDDPEALIADIRGQLDKLSSLYRQLG